MTDAICLDGNSCPQPGEDARDRAIAELASRQHGVVARRQLLALGLGPDVIGYRLERCRLHPIHRGVYAVGHDKLTREARWMAAVLAGGPGAVLSHRSAAALRRAGASFTRSDLEELPAPRRPHASAPSRHEGTRVAFERDREKSRILQAPDGAACR
jgi:hypothetical protein